MSNSEKSVPFSLNKIGLSLSGGGYRAALYHLGTLSYLNRINYRGKPLLENVKVISTVSGGSITGVVYAKHLVEYKDSFVFGNFYNFLKTKLHSLDLVSESLAYLKDDAKFKNQFKSKNLINAFAELYDHHFTEGKTFEIFKGLKETSLNFLIVNSTEFKFGNNFRFVDLNPNNRRIFGNKMIRVNKLIAKEVKLSDAIAASSCFPGGFEPIIWPKDFLHNDSSNLNSKKGEIENIGLMDGGIYDNQGISSLTSKNDLDLIIVSDVCSPYITTYRPTKNNAVNYLKNQSINSFIQKFKSYSKTFNRIVFFSLIVHAFIFLFSNFFWKGVLTGSAIIVIGVWVIKKVVEENYIKGLFKHIHEKIIGEIIPEFFRQRINKSGFLDLPIKKLEPLLINRAKSLEILFTEVFLKNIRRLNYQRLFNDKKFENKRIATLIKEMTWAGYFENSKMRLSYSPRISEEEIRREFFTKFGPFLPIVAEKAAEFGTTLWFAEEEKKQELMDCLIASGQFNMCYNLWEYLNKILNNDNFADLFIQNPPLKIELETIRNMCLDDWEAFKKNPMHLL